MSHSCLRPDPVPEGHTVRCRTCGSGFADGEIAWLDPECPDLECCAETDDECCAAECLEPHYVGPSRYART